MRGAVSSSMFMLAWMSVLSCVLTRPGIGKLEAALTVGSIVASLLAMLSEVGAVEAKEEGVKTRLDVVLQAVALLAFVARVSVHAYLSLS